MRPVGALRIHRGTGSARRLERVAWRPRRRPVDRVALRRGGEVDDELGEGQGALGQADEVDGLLRGHGQDQRLRVGEAHVLGGEAHQPARDVERVLAGLEHAREPVEPGVGVRVADRLVQRA